MNIFECTDLFCFHLMQDKLPAPVAQTVEFRFLLYLTCKNASKQIIQVSYLGIPVLVQLLALKQMQLSFIF